MSDNENLALLRQEVEQIMLRPDLSAVVKSDLDSHKVTALLVRAKQAAGDLKLQKAQALSPHEAVIRSIKTQYDPLIEELAMFERRGKAALAGWIEREAERVRLENEKETAMLASMADEVEALRSQGLDASLPAEMLDNALTKAEQRPGVPVTAFRGETGTASTSQKWKAAIVKPEDVPREFCLPHMPLINAAIRLGTRQIAGVSITQETSVSVRIRQ